jgi:small subunit ribosomal protein S20
LANLKQSIKRARYNDKRRLINKRNFSIVRTVIKKFLSSINSKDNLVVKNLYKLSCSNIDKCVTKGIFHKNKASRLKHRLNKKFKSTGM